MTYKEAVAEISHTNGTDAIAIDTITIDIIIILDNIKDIYR
jgi:hypothetical protein